jgi:hypothetical protein
MVDYGFYRWGITLMREIMTPETTNERILEIEIKIPFIEHRWGAGKQFEEAIADRRAGNFWPMSSKEGDTP